MHDPTGERHGIMTVLGYSGRKYKNGDRYVNAKCDCGVIKEMSYPSLKNPRGSRSCGCQRWKGTHNACGTPLYRSWLAMHNRCTCPTNKSYPNYGGRGISVHRRWDKFENFRDDMQKTFEPGLVLDRIDNNKGYFKSNCRWATRAENNRNTRANINFLVDGRVLCLAEVVREYGKAQYRLALWRFRGGWEIHQAIEAFDSSIEFTEII